MGNNSSKINCSSEINCVDVKRQAMKNFNIRLNMYSYQLHGDYNEYVNWCHREYDLECIQDIKP